MTPGDPFFEPWVEPDYLGDDEPVEQDRRAVREPREQAGQVFPVRRGGTRPRAGRDHLPYRQIVLKVVENLPVVAVAAAGCRRIVDPVRQHHVERKAHFRVRS